MSVRLHAGQNRNPCIGQSNRCISCLCTLLLVLLLSTPLNHALAEKRKEKSATTVQKYIRNVTVQVEEIFPNHNGGIYGAANNLKINTRESTIRRDLLFKEGDSYDPFLIRESERVLRTLRFLRDVTITDVHDGDAVDVTVKAQDTWTIIPQVSFSSGDGRQKRSVGLAESNLLGWGKRLEMVYSEDEQAESLQGVYDDRNLFGTVNQLQMGYLDGSLGETTIFDIGNPFRSLAQDDSWRLQVEVNDGLGRLFEAGDESFVYQTQSEDISLYYAIAEGKPSEVRHRLFGGIQYRSERFQRATEEDLYDLDIDPDSIDLNADMLADNRRFSGFFLNYSSIEEDFMPMNYIDRFSRVVDYNLGEQFTTRAFISPRLLGSEDDTLLMSGFYATGWRLSPASFLRGEINGNGRMTSQRLENGIFHSELKYYHLFGPVFWGDQYLGKHTLGISFELDHAVNLDEDKQFLLGADNGLRGYEARTFAGDKGWLLNIEERAHIAENIYELVSLGGAVFADIGGVTDESFGRLFSDNTYADIGAGLRFAFPRSSGERVLRVDFALPLRDGIDGSKTFEVRIIFSGGQLFSSRLTNERLGLSRATTEQDF